MARSDSAAAGAQAGDSVVACAQAGDSVVAGAQAGDSVVAGAQAGDSVVAGAQTRSNTGEVPPIPKFDWQTCARVIGSAVIIIHLILLAAYASLGLSSRDEDNYLGIFVYGGSIITAFSHIMVYWADVNKLTSSIFERGQGESTGAHWAKAGLMGIVLPVFNFIGLIVMFTMVGQDGKTFALGIVVFITYFLGNALLFFNKGESTESEEHELRDNNPPADNPPADNSTADNALVHNSPAANSSVDNSPTVDAPATNSLIDNSSVDYSPANNSLRPSICTFP